jgi:DNA-binding MarR family transcriptional regulator
MLNGYRREHILEHLSNHNRLTVSGVAASLNVSDETVRRDLKDLEKEGLLRRVHGGAIGVSPNRDDPISERVQKHAKEKRIIAKLAADMIRPNLDLSSHRIDHRGTGKPARRVLRSEGLYQFSQRREDRQGPFWRDGLRGTRPVAQDRIRSRRI